MTSTPSTPLFTAAPCVRWDAVTPTAQEEATNRQSALRPALERWESPLITRDELETSAANAYAQLSGETVNVRTVRRWIQRAMERDSGQRDWSRPELFLRENPPLRAQHRAELTAAEEPLAPLFDIITSFTKTGEPTPEEEALLWLRAWQLHRASLASGVAPKTAKAELLRFLLRHGPWLTGGQSRDALRVMVARQFRKHDHAGRAGKNVAEVAIDGRVAKRGEPTAPPIPAEDIEKAGSYALFATGKRLAQAKRELIKAGEESGISPATLDLLNRGHSKSYVNRRFAAAVQPMIRAAAPYVLGKQAIDDATPSLQCDYSKLRSLGIVTGDDFTLVVPFPVDDGRGWFKMTVGQCLLFADVRSRKIIARVLVPTESYSSLDVSSGMNTVCLEEGIPGEWRFENGLWKKSKLVKRPPDKWRDAHSSPSEVEFGWEKLGVRFVHCKRARSKPAENIGGLLQNFMERCPGYRGRTARYDCPEETRRMLLAVEAKRMHPLDYFWSYDQWLTELDSLIELYNADRQDGRILDRRTPNEAYQEFWPKHEVSKMDASCWHLVAHYVREFDVTPDGIQFQVGRNSFAFFDDALGPLVHKRVLGWFDPTHPHVLGVTTLDKKNPVFVKRRNPSDIRAAYSTDPEVVENYQRELAKQSGFMRHSKETFRAFKGAFERNYRQNFTDRQTAALGKEMLAQRSEALQQSSEESRRHNRILKLARELNTPVETLRDFSPETEQSLRRRLERRKGSLTVNDTVDPETP